MVLIDIYAMIIINIFPLKIIQKNVSKILILLFNYGSISC